MAARFPWTTAPAIAAMLLLTPVAAQQGLPFEHVRSLDARAQRLLLDAWRSSETVRALVSVLDASDVVVDVQTQAPRNGGYRGHLHFATAVHGLRYLRLSIAAFPDGMIPVLAHELQHAVEIAQATDVRDPQALAVLFRRIGWSRSEGQFETEAALMIEERVRRELHRTR